ncbi:C-type lectin-1, partial [Aphelenchoides avenae]
AFASNGWEEDEKRCQSENAHLVSIHSRSENAYVLGLASNIKGSGTDISIGLKKSATDGDFTWTDGTPLDYKYWAKNEPKQVDGVACVRMKNSVRVRDPNYARWEVIDCSSKQKVAVCKQPVDFEEVAFNRRH